MNEPQSGLMPDAFDAAVARLTDLPDVVKTSIAPVRVVDAYGNSTSYTLQSFRQAKEGDTVFLEVSGKEGRVRIVIPPPVSKVIERQRKSLTAKSRKKGAMAAVNTRAERGIVPFAKKAEA